MYTFDRIKKNLKARSVKSFESGEDGCLGVICYRASVLRFQFSFGLGWEHVSVSREKVTPTWEEMCLFKDIFWPDDEACVQYHPAKKDYVNFHKHCLHIWRPIHSVFPTPSAEMVGPLS